MHPCDVAFQRIDFAIVRDVTIRMRKLPTRKCIRRKALVYEAQRAGYIRIGKFAVEICNLWREQQALIDNRPRRERGNVKKFFILNVGRSNLILRALADHIQLPLKRILVLLWRTRDKNLLDVRLRDTRNSSNGLTIDRR